MGWKQWGRIIGGVAAGCVMMAGLAWAGQPNSGGTVVALPELQSFNATVQSEARTGLGPTFAMLLGFAAGGIALASPMLGAFTAGVAFYLGFVPSITGGTFNSVQGADWTALVAVPGPWDGQWFTPVLALAYPAMQVGLLLADPVVWVAMAVAGALLFARRSEGRHVGLVSARAQ